MDAVFVPPAAEKLSDLLSDFEKFLNNDEINVPNLVKIAIAHYQFETMLVTGDFNHKNTGENRQKLTNENDQKFTSHIFNYSIS